MWSKCSEKYEVSTDGHIRNAKTGCILHEFVGKDGYLRTQFDGKSRLIHRVVAKTFIENPGNLSEVNHISGCKADNSVNNLEWCSRPYNQRHAYTRGLRSVSGVRNPRCKLSEEDVSYIREHYVRGDDQYGGLALANRFGVARQTISAVLSGQNWKEKNL